MNNTDLIERLTIAAAPHGIAISGDTLPDGRERLLYVYTAAAGSYECWGSHIGDLTTEDLTDLIALFENMPIDEENSMNIYSTDLFQFMAGDMLGQSTIALTIADVTMESMSGGSGKGGAQTKPCLRFRERSKLMVLNKTNAKTLAGVLGPETENWKGARVTIAAPVVDAFGKSVRSLRITDVQPEKIVAAKPRPNSRESEATYGDGSPVAESALAGYRDYLAANNQPPADVRALLAWQQGDLFGDDALAEATGADAYRE